MLRQFLVLVVSVLSSADVLGEPSYFIRQSVSPPKYPTGFAVCDAFRQQIQDSQDEVNPGGTTTIVQAPPEDLYPNLRRTATCQVNWSRTINGNTSSFDFYANIARGGCLEGRSPIPGSGEYPAEPYDCQQSPACPSPLTYDYVTATCQKECPADKPWDGVARDCGAPPEPQSCNNLAGNPINFFNGHKRQKEIVFEAEGDFPLTFSWRYNSFGNHQKTGAGYSLGAGVSGATTVHTEQPLPAGE
ncbi:DUF6531 domain-containing protein, partial [Microbulbifer sp. 2201CG32-9]|uniref:DUF6531 domain-containing protein n=1 Tax=Microbulbifer sp. 2201CG32-9 TaxID=3232309 RepID=UPI00345B7206